MLSIKLIFKRLLIINDLQEDMSKNNFQIIDSLKRNVDVILFIFGIILFIIAYGVALILFSMIQGFYMK